MVRWDRHAGNLIVGDLTEWETAFLRAELITVHQMVSDRLRECVLTLPFGVDIDLMMVVDEARHPGVRHLIAEFLSQHPREIWPWHEYYCLSQLAEGCDCALRRLPEHRGRIELAGHAPEWFYGALRGMRVLASSRAEHEPNTTSPDGPSGLGWLQEAINTLYRLITAPSHTTADPRHDPADHN